MRGNKPRILGYMRKHEGITSMMAFDLFGITRLAAHIKDLRDLGYDIETVMLEGENRYGETTRFAKYVLRGEPDGK